MEKKTSRTVLTAIVVLIVVVLGFNIIQSFTQTVEEEEARIMPVEVSKAAKGDITQITTLTSAVNAKQEAAIIPKTGGRIEKVLVEVGDVVEAGDILMQIEQDELRAQLKQAEAGLAAAKANESAVMAAHEDARINLERMERLYAEGAISSQQLEGARLNYESSKPASFYAQIQQAQAAVESARLQLSNTEITSPISGIIIAVMVKEGQMVGPSGAVAMVMDLDEMEINLGVVEQHVKNLRTGEEVQVRVASASREPFVGIIKSVSAGTDQRGTFPVVISLDNPEHEIRGGMSAEVRLPTQHAENVLMVPIDSVVNQRGRQTVFVVEDERAFSRTVELGLKDDKYVEIVSGLEEGEVILTKGQSVVSDGDMVAVQDGDK